MIEPGIDVVIGIPRGKRPGWGLVVLPAGQRASGEWIDDTLRRRAEEAGLLARTPLAGRFPRHRVEVVRAADPVDEVNRLFEARGWTDGLPVVPPTLARVEAMCATTVRAPADVLGEVAAALVAEGLVVMGTQLHYLVVYGYEIPEGVASDWIPDTFGVWDPTDASTKVVDLGDDYAGQDLTLVFA